MTSLIPPLWTSLALALSCLALLIAYLNSRRKSSLSLRASFSWTRSSVDATDQHISSLIIENLKDRAATIFTVCLRVGHNFYIEIEDFQDKPLVLRVFETWHSEYGPIEFYSVNGRRIDMNALFDDKRVGMHIVLSTSDGKYVVKKRPKRWTPIHDFFQNYMTAVVRPVSSNYKGKVIGGTVSYAVEVVSPQGTSEVVALHKNHFQSQRFKNFRLSKESLESADNLGDFLQKQVEERVLTCSSFEVADIAAWREKERHHYKGAPIKAKYAGSFSYSVLGRLLTFRRNRKLARENLRRRNEAERARR
jgi:hypothetical protein